MQHPTIARSSIAFIAFLLGASQAFAGEPCCDPITPPDQGLDTPDLNFTDDNGDGIDGMACGPIFVSLSGSDMNSGTMESPMRTVTAASLAASLLDPVRDVYVSSGVFEEPLLLVPGINIYGGYDPSDWSRTGAQPTTLRSNNVAARYTGAASAITMQLVTIETPTTMNPSGHAVGLYLDSPGATVSLEAVSILTGHAGDGLNGAPGTQGADGANGNNGNGPTGGNGGPGMLAGGNGGDGRYRDSGLPGQSGQGGAPGGFGGNGGAGCNDGQPDPGGPGAPGAVGADGPNGASGLAFHQSGENGSQGVPGGGGGGGGAGQGENCRVLGECVFCGTGRGGGGGGAGGSGGGPGQGGKPGGSSIAIFVNNGIVNIDSASALLPGDGGNGGDGGPGGPGGTGGEGGMGASNADDSEAAGGPGGDGGDGGDGGHGAGGAGGWSAGALNNSANGAAINDAGALITPGAPGNGGGGPGNPGGSGGAVNIEPVVADLPQLAPSPAETGAHARGATEPGVLVELDYALANPACVPDSITLASLPPQGSAQAIGDQIFYTPNNVFTGEVTFQFNVFDTNGQCALGIAHVTIRAPGEEPCEDPCTADINGDGVVDTADLGILIGQFGTNCAP